MKKKIIALGLLISLAAVFTTACGGSKTYKDGTYEGKSEVFEYENEDGSDDGNGYGVVKITIKDQKITDCEFTTYEPNGTVKDENYGKKQGEVANQDFYNKAQKAVAACEQYARLLVEQGSADGIDAISGATKNYEQFLDAVDKALEQAEE